MPFVGLPNGKRRTQNVRCQKCLQDLQIRVPKWINGQRFCTTCACSLSAFAKYAKCVDCRAAEAMNPPLSPPSTQRTCDHCAKVLPSYEQSRRVCHSCGRKQLRQRLAAKVDTLTSPPRPVEAPLALPSHILQRFRLIAPSPASGSSAGGSIARGIPLTRGRAILPAPQKSSSSPAALQPAPWRRRTVPIDSNLRSRSSNTSDI